MPSENAGRDENVFVMPVKNGGELTFKLGLWLSGLESFLNIRNHSFAEENHTKVSGRDWSREFRLTNSALLLCSRLAFQLGKALKDGKSAGGSENGFDFTSEEVYELSLALKEAVLINQGMLRAAPIKFGEWTAWSNLLSGKFKSVGVFDKLIKNAEQEGEKALPEHLAKLLGSKALPLAVKADLQLVLPLFAKVLKWLSVIGEMLKNDEPLKPSLLIFSRIYEQINELTNYINNRLRRFPNEEDELFGTLDGAAYTASIELRKVFNHELSGIADIRTTPSVFAKIETAYALLNDSFQLTLITFAQLIEPSIESDKIFPNLKVKLEQSIVLRQKMWGVLQDVRNAEQNPGNFPLEKLNEKLTDFRDTTQPFLFYKDRETMERFIEEVLITSNNKDLVPILHRFGAYIETLFGQVNMRVVLANHPFEG
ncbi:MAG: hypothetical protein R2747_01625 [Pyrinomonadaceae bacterium]